MRAWTMAAAVAMAAGTAWAEDPMEKQKAEAREAVNAYAELGQPSAGHKLLGHFIGVWEVTTRAWLDPSAPPIESKGEVTKTWDLEGRFVREDLRGTSAMNEPYRGLGFLGYDNGTQRYQGVWMSTVQTGMITYSGKANTQDAADAKPSFTFTGTETSPMGDGEKLDFRIEVVVESADRHTLTFFYLIPGAPGQAPMPHKAFDMVHVRKK